MAAYDDLIARLNESGISISSNLDTLDAESVLIIIDVHKIAIAVDEGAAIDELFEWIRLGKMPSHPGIFMENKSILMGAPELSRAADTFGYPEDDREHMPVVSDFSWDYLEIIPAMKPIPQHHAWNQHPGKPGKAQARLKNGRK